MKYGLIGEKLSHSFSAEIHKQLFDYEYTLQELPAEQLNSFMLRREFCAVNVTIPYKEAVIPHLDWVDESAQQIGAVNTVVNRDGKLYGYNTDFDGLYGLIVRRGIAVEGKKVLILGSGGTSKTAMAVVKRLGCASVWRASRTARDGCITYECARECHVDAQILINTTPCGMYPNYADVPVDLGDYPHLENVVDVVYNPLRTKLVCDAEQRGIPAVGGLYMLVAQAAAAAQHFVGKTVSQERIDEIYHGMASQENIVLIGMPGCGKTTIGKRLATLLNRPFVDTDAWIVNEMNASIPDIFQRVGESGFRDCEAQAIRQIGTKRGMVIATGGGSVLRPENVERLKGNGRLYFLDRPLSQLTPTSDRPLSSNFDDLQKRYEERHPVYSAVCDVKIKAVGTMDEVSNLIREDFLNERFSDKRP